MVPVWTATADGESVRIPSLSRLARESPSARLDGGVTGRNKNLTTRVSVPMRRTWSAMIYKQNIIRTRIRARTYFKLNTRSFSEQHDEHHETHRNWSDRIPRYRFGSRSPETGRIVQTSYSAGPRGFRARGPDIARQTDLSQIRLPYSPPVPVDSSKYDPSYDRYYDPNEDPSYAFTVRTPTQSKSETADSGGHVEGAYSYLDDVGERNVYQ